MSPNLLASGKRVSATATHATSSVATISGVAGTSIYLTDVSGSSDKSGALILVKDGSTTIWQDIVNAGNYNRSFLTPLKITAGADLTITVDGTSLCKSNAAGVQL